MSSEEYIVWWKGVYPFTNRDKSFVYTDSKHYLDIFYRSTEEDEAMSETVAKQVAEDIKSMNADVSAELINALVDREKMKRVDALVICYDKWQKLRTEIKKAERFDEISMDKDGKIISETYSKKAFEALKTLREKADRIAKVVEKAINGDPTDAYNLARDKGDGGNKSEEGTDTSSAQESH